MIPNEQFSTRAKVDTKLVEPSTLNQSDRLIHAHKLKNKQDDNAKNGEEANKMGMKLIKGKDATKIGMMSIIWG